MNYAAAYRKMHDEGHFFGMSILPHVEAIAALVEKHDAKTILDYGSGKGMQYVEERVHERWGGILPVCYDVGVEALAVRPERRFDGVICTDVLEHIAEPDLPGIWADLFGYAERFLFVSVSTRLAKKSFPDGRNVHLTVRPRKWWKKQIIRYNPGIAAVLVVVP